MSINKAIISGNLTRDAELRATASGMAVLSLGIAVNDRRKNPQTGEWEDYPNFVDCTMFGTRAESVSRFLAKGSKVAIEGKLRWSSWEKDGQKRSKLEVIVDDIELMQTRQQQPQQQYAPQQPAMNYVPQAPAPQQAPQQPQQPMQAQQAPQQQQMAGMPAPQQTAPSIYDGDIPF